MTSRIIFAALVGILCLTSPAGAQVTVYGQVSGDSGVLEWAIVRWYGTTLTPLKFS